VVRGNRSDHTLIKSAVVLHEHVRDEVCEHTHLGGGMSANLPPDKLVSYLCSTYILEARY